MENLAGNTACDIEIEKELIRARIEVVRGVRQNNEVPASITGKLGSFTFDRAWYYWIAYGKMPLEVARELYDDPVGKTDIRVAGHCGCPPPEEYVKWFDAKGREILPRSTYDHYAGKYGADSPLMKKILKTCCFAEEPSKEGRAFVTTYHIDSEVGLRLFADTIRKYKLL